ncbi:hypothetical protein FTO70_05255 [Methanosarcina sp. KYL-1]|uniref:hypothetical protein n=1 Tax=Methanosarcina sp. KYL-1 TaxID=2602068 RepID=UPI0021018400|nr:hypothetical protein [Methanosarcina sp. KYL-1]MCQ1535105.1 hypothetical protein [Methanosarcina sp. KYL-1]
MRFRHKVRNSDTLENEVNEEIVLRKIVSEKCSAKVHKKCYPGAKNSAGTKSSLPRKNLNQKHENKKTTLEFYTKAVIYQF